MRVLFIGGTGNISLAVTRLLAEQGVEVTVLNRGSSEAPLPDGVRTIRADIRDAASASEALRGQHFDVAVDLIAFTPQHVELDIALFSRMASQYVFISSATVYRKPPSVPIVEDAPLGNPVWEYARDKVVCEERLRREHEQKGFPVTIAAIDPGLGVTLLGDKAHSLVFDNSKLKRVVPGFQAVVPFADGVAQSLAWFNADPARQTVDAERDALLDRIAAAYQAVLPSAS